MWRVTQSKSTQDSILDLLLNKKKNVNKVNLFSLYFFILLYLFKQANYWRQVG